MTDNLQINNWIFTNVKVIDTNFVWVISNFSYYITERGEGVSSPEFLDEKSNIKWFLALYPNGQEDADHLALYVHCTPSVEKKVAAKYRLRLLNDKGETVHQVNWSPVRKFCQKGWGRSKFIKRSELFDNADKYLPNDSLTILCEVKISGGTEETSGQNYGTKINGYFTEESLSEDFSKYWRTGLHSDIMLIMDDKKFPAHKFILSLRSTFFRDAIEKLALNENKSSFTLEIDDNYNVMIEVLRYIYTGKIENYFQSSVCLLAAADKYNLKGLKLLCECKLMNTISVVNAASLLSNAVLYQAWKLKTAVFDFIITELPQVMKTPGYQQLKISNPELIAEILSETVKNGGSELSDDTSV